MELGSTLPVAEAAGSIALCITEDVTFPRPPFEHMARDVQQLKQLTPSLLPRFPCGLVGAVEGTGALAAQRWLPSSLR